MANSEILINQLFAGTYLREGNNIGHEIINLFEDDCGVRYLYITPSGIVKGHDVESVLFVRNTQARRTVEVIALAYELSPVEKSDLDNIRYGGVTPEQIFRSNTYHGGDDVFSGIVSYKANVVKMPLSRLFITLDNGFNLSSWPGSILLNSTKRVIIPQGMRMYYSEQSDPEAYSQLHALISNESLWQSADVMGQLISDRSIVFENPPFLEVIGKEDDELVFSNLLAYYFNYNHNAFIKFAASNDLLSIPNMENDFEVVRETNFNIDLWIESKKHVIVIENKIKSGINGIDKAYGSQLEKYRVLAQEYATQYNKEAHYYVLAPDYNVLNLSSYDPDNLYRIIPYSAVFAFFISNASAYISDRFFPDFLRGLERHTMTASELNFKTMKTRFLRRISQAQ